MHELAIAPDHKMAFVPLYGDGIYGANKKIPITRGSGN